MCVFFGFFFKPWIRRNPRLSRYFSPPCSFRRDFLFLQIIVWGADVDDDDDDEEGSRMVVKVALLLQKPSGLSDGATCAI